MASVKVGPTTVAGGAVTLAAYGVAVVAFIQGARDEQTISALVIGTLSLLTTLGGRYAQAVAAVKAIPPPDLSFHTKSGEPFSEAYVDRDLGRWGRAWNEPRPGVAVTNQVTAPTKPEAAAPYTPDGDPLDGEDDDDTDRLAQLPDESFTADPDDTAGADDHPETA